jgi:Major royal jelly protein
MKLASLILFVSSLTIVISHRKLALDSVREWKQLDFNFPDPQARADAIQKGLFVQRNAFPIDVDVDYQGKTRIETELFSPCWYYCHIRSAPLDKSRIFVTVPRFNLGVPVTLGFVKSPKTDLLIEPYPDYSWHSSHGDDCDNISSAIRVAIDGCNQLWVLDTGVVARRKKCPPQLLVFNLFNDKLVKRYKFPASQHTELSLFTTPVRLFVIVTAQPWVRLTFSLFVAQILDVQDPAPIGSCLNTKVYITDTNGFALIVYDAVTNKSWRIQNKLVRFLHLNTNQST